MNLFDKIFGKSEEKIVFDKKNPIEDSPIRRNQAFKDSYENWKLTSRFQEFKKDFYEKLKIAYLSKGTMSMNIFHQSDGFSGFHLDIRTLLESEIEGNFLIEWLKEKTSRLSYRVQYSNLKIFVRQDQIIKEETYYLKPQITDFNPPVSQEFGNIRYVVDYKNDWPENLKIELTFYTGYNYQNAKTVSDFLKAFGLSLD